MEPSRNRPLTTGCHIIFPDYTPPRLGTIKEISASQISYEWMEDIHKRFGILGGCSPSSFVEISVYNGRPVFGRLSSNSSTALEELQKALNDYQQYVEASDLEKTNEKQIWLDSKEERRKSLGLADSSRLEKTKKTSDAELARQNDPTHRKITDLINHVIRDPLRYATPIRPGKPDLEDCNLSKKWINQSSLEDDSLNEVTTKSAEAMMLSARMAEKAVILFFKSRGDLVLDVSLQQLRNPDLTDWVSHDLTASGLCIDVKNGKWIFSR